MLPAQLDAVLFDAGGTLMRLDYACMAKIVRAHGAELDRGSAGAAPRALRAARSTRRPAPSGASPAPTRPAARATSATCSARPRWARAGARDPGRAGGREPRAQPVAGAARARGGDAPGPARAGAAHGGRLERGRPGRGAAPRRGPRRPPRAGGRLPLRGRREARPRDLPPRALAHGRARRARRLRGRHLLDRRGRGAGRRPLAGPDRRRWAPIPTPIASGSSAWPSCSTASREGRKVEDA